MRLPQQPIRLERLARELDASPDELRWWLAEEVQRRRQVTKRAEDAGTPPA